ncbi:MAG: hypothetical protein Kow0092_13560 [Deferrisomatales bacterium]
MDCRAFEALWEAREGGALSPTEEAAWQRHRKGCLRCARRLRHMAQLDARLQEALGPPARPPPHLLAHTLARLGRPARGRSGPRAGKGTWVVLVATGSACLGLLLGALAWGSGRWAADPPGPRGVQVGWGSSGSRAAGGLRLEDLDGSATRPDAAKADAGGGRWVFRVQLAPGRYQYACAADPAKGRELPPAPGGGPNGRGGIGPVLHARATGAGWLDTL